MNNYKSHYFDIVYNNIVYISIVFITIDIIIIIVNIIMAPLARKRARGGGLLPGHHRDLRQDLALALVVAGDLHYDCYYYYYCYYCTTTTTTTVLLLYYYCYCDYYFYYYYYYYSSFLFGLFHVFLIHVFIYSSFSLFIGFCISCIILLFFAGGLRQLHPKRPCVPHPCFQKESSRTGRALATARKQR